MHPQRNIIMLILGLFCSLLVGGWTYEIYLNIKTSQFKNDFEKVLYSTWHEKVTQTSSTLIALAENLEYCNPISIQALQYHEYHNPDVRLFGWFNEDLQVCTSRPGLSKVSPPIPTILERYPYEQHLDLVLFEKGKEKQPKVILLLQHQTQQWFAIFEPWVLFSSPQSCPLCVDVFTRSQDGVLPTFHIGALPVYVKYDTTAIRLQQKSTALFMGGLCVLLLSVGTITIFLWQRIRYLSPTLQLKRAIDQGEIQPYFQLIIDTRTGKATHCEVLARWIQGGTLMPANEFIPLAESSGLIDTLLLSLINQTLSMTHSNPTIFRSITFSFNVSPSQLERPNFVTKLTTHLHSAAIPIGLEITEREPFESLSHAQVVLNSLKKIGVILELDDVGTGYNSFASVKELGIDIIKIDKMFIDTIMYDDLKRKVLDGIIEFGHTAQVTLIAEGVEHEKQAEYLYQKGVFLHQGFLYCKPLDKTSFLVRLSSIHLDKN